MDRLLMKSGGWLLVALLAMMAIAASADFGFSVHLAIIAAAALAVMTHTLRSADFAGLADGTARAPAPTSRYDDDPIRWGVIATLFWGVAGFAAGLFIALQLAFPTLNLGLEYTTFGRLRLLHTSAVIFAFGGNALIATSFYIVQRTCRARLAFPTLARRLRFTPGPNHDETMQDELTGALVEIFERLEMREAA